MLLRSSEIKPVFCDLSIWALCGVIVVGLLLCVVCFCGGLVVVCGVAVVGVVCSLPRKLWWVLVSWLSELLGLAGPPALGLLPPR